MLHKLDQKDRKARIVSIKAIEAISYIPKNITKREAKTIFQNFAPVVKEFVTDFFISADRRKHPRKIDQYTNRVKNTTLNVCFPGKRIGAFRSFFSYKRENIISNIREIFEKSIYAYSSNYIIIEPRHDGSIHKEHPNIIAYHHFVDKVIVNNEKYYVRFTVHEERKSKGNLHSAHISEIAIINEKSRGCNRSLLGIDQGGTAQPAYDYNLTEFFNSVKSDVRNQYI